MYLHCSRCQLSINAAYLVGSNPACPRCGEPAAGPLSLFSTLPGRYRKRKGKGGNRFTSPRRGTADSPPGGPSRIAHP